MTLSTQFLTMLSMIAMGVLFGSMLDTYQRFLKRAKRNNWLVFINDILFWVIQALLIFYILFHVNKGEIRFYIFIALLCGFAAYKGLLQTIYLRVLEIAISSFISFCEFMKKSIYLLVYKPVKGLFQLVIFMILFLGRGLITLVKFIFKVILLIMKVLGKILLTIWKLLPKGIKNPVEKLYNRLAGNFKGIKNYFGNWLNKWKKGNK